MRILSQKGLHTVDLNYDSVGVSVSFIDPCEIIAYSIMEHNDKCWTMAKYSTPEKAEKALEMLRAAYDGTYVEIQNLSESDRKSTWEEIKDIEISLIRLPKKYECEYFRFPADEDVDIEESEATENGMP